MLAMAAVIVDCTFKMCF